MRKVGILLVAAALGLMVVQTAMSGRGAVRGGMRGAVIGNAVGGSEGAEKGAKVGVVTGATRTAIGREATARGTYQATTEYQDAPRSNFAEAPPDVLGAGSAGDGTKPSGEAVIRKDGKAVVGVTFPEDWKQKTGDAYIAAVSKDGQCYAVLATLGVDDKAAGVKKMKAGLENHIKEIKFDEQAETKGGALVVTGTGKGKKAGIPVVFAAAIFEADKGQFVGAAFVTDSKIEEHYKETVSGICQTLRRAKDFDKDGK
jgi:hypothetical protein